jgi:hypothetical protein
MCAVHPLGDRESRLWLGLAAEDACAGFMTRSSVRVRHRFLGRVRRAVGRQQQRPHRPRSTPGPSSPCALAPRPAGATTEHGGQPCPRLVIGAASYLGAPATRGPAHRGWRHRATSFAGCLSGHPRRSALWTTPRARRRRTRRRDYFGVLNPSISLDLLASTRTQSPCMSNLAYERSFMPWPLARLCRPGRRHSALHGRLDSMNRRSLKDLHGTDLPQPRSLERLPGRSSPPLRSRPTFAL